MKTLSPKSRTNISAKANLPLLYVFNPHLLAYALVYYHLAAKLPTGQSTANGMTSLVLFLLIYSFGLLNDLYKPKGMTDVFSKKTIFNQNQVFLVRSIVAALIFAVLILFFYLKDLWLFVAVMTACAGAYVYLFNRTFPDKSFDAIRLFCSAALLMSTCFGLSWISESTGKENIFAFVLSFLVIWQNALIKKDFSGSTSGLKKGSSNGNQNLVRGISLLIIVIGLSACYLCEYRFSQRFFTILILTGIAQGFCSWRKDIFSKKQHIQLILRVLPLLPMTIL